MISKVSSAGELKKSLYLNARELIEGGHYKKVALVSDNNTGLDRRNHGYVTFFLKDVNANVISAKLFNVEDYAMCGINASSFKGRPVIVSFVAQIYRGQVSLVIDSSEGIRTWDGEFDLEKFVGKIEYNLDLVNSVGMQIFSEEWKVPERFKTCTFARIAQGRIGAFAKVLEMSMSFLLTSQTLVGINSKEMFAVFLYSMEYYYEILEESKQYNVLSSFKKRKVLRDIDLRFRDDELGYLVADTVTALADLGKAEHVIAHLIHSTVKNAIRILELTLISDGLSMGAFIEIGGDVLSKY